uniref:Uncharacterized protein n=1 Tax=viral metagenome TaxID=1070528 RepID=A0A2V0RJR6_9ZZZZ
MLITIGVILASHQSLVMKGHYQEMADKIFDSGNFDQMSVPSELSFAPNNEEIPAIWKNLPRDANGKLVPSLTDYKIYDAVSNGRRPVGIEIMRLQGDSELYVGRDNNSEVHEMTPEQAGNIRNNASDRYGLNTPDELTLTREVGNELVIDKESTQLNRLWSKYVQRKQVGQSVVSTDGTNIESLVGADNILIDDVNVASTVKAGDLFSGSGIPSGTRIKAIGIAADGRTSLTLSNAVEATITAGTDYSLHRGNMYFNRSITEENDFMNMPAINSHETVETDLSAAELLDLNAGPDTGTVTHEVKTVVEREALNTEMGMASNEDLDSFLQLDENGQTVEMENLKAARATAEENLTNAFTEGTGEDTLRIAGGAGSGYALHAAGLVGGLVAGWVAEKSVEWLDPNHKLGLYGDSALSGALAGGGMAVATAVGTNLLAGSSSLFAGMALGPEILAGAAAGVVGTAVSKAIYDRMMNKGYSEKAAYAASTTTGATAGGFTAGVIVTGAVVLTGVETGELIGGVIGTVGGPLGAAAGVVVGGLIGAGVGAVVGGVMSLWHSLW